MFSPSSGVAVARVTAAGNAAVYLARTNDGGRSWHELSAFPRSLTLPAVPPPPIAFAPSGAGYLLDPASGEVLFTGDAGVHWARVAIPGRARSITDAAGSLWATTASCGVPATIPAFCATDLVAVPFGKLRPFSVTTIPTIGPVRSARRHHSPWAANLLASPAAGAAVFVEGGEGGPTSLLETPDGGRSWRLVADPCHHLVPTSLVAPSPHRWILCCSLNAGMNHDTNEIYASTSGGRRWRLVAATNETGSLRAGAVSGALDFRLVVSRNGGLLWLLSTVGPVSVSADDGRTWRASAHVSGGFDSSFATAGATAAWLADPGRGLYRTLNGRNWRLLR